MSVVDVQLFELLTHAAVRRDVGRALDFGRNRSDLYPQRHFIRIEWFVIGIAGLGLCIVKAISDRIGAEIQLGFSDEPNGSGLCVCVLIPMTDHPSQKEYGDERSGYALSVLLTWNSTRVPEQLYGLPALQRQKR